jgi:hypothetical protein
MAISSSIIALSAKGLIMLMDHGKVSFVIVVWMSLHLRNRNRLRALKKSIAECVLEL